MSSEYLENSTERQSSHYLYLSKLQKMVQKLPSKYQQRLNNELLSELAQVLLDDRIFEIISGLEEVQHLTERHLYDQRVQLINEQRLIKSKLKKKHKDLLFENSSKPHNMPIIQKQCEEELKKFANDCDKDLTKKDMKIILELDQKVMDQQSMLEKFGMPLFVVTNNPDEIKMQMQILQLVVDIAKTRNNFDAL